LRSELANAQPTTNGAALVGYYDDVNAVSTTVAAQLTYLTGYVLASTPTGSMLDFAGTSAPTGFLLCDGAAVSRATYDDLFSVIGVTWGIGDGSTTFNVPDYRRRVAIGAGGSGSATIGNAVGDTGGAETETLTDPLQLPAHNHTATTTSTTAFPIANTAGQSPLNSVTLSKPAGGTSSVAITSTTAIGNTGASAAFNIIQSAAIALKIIKT
jgi:microcystin-dependent protein